MQTVNVLPISNTNFITVSIPASSSTLALLPKDAAGNIASYYYFQAAKGIMQISLDTNIVSASNFVSKFILLDGQSLVVQCEGVRGLGVTTLSAVASTLYITALDCS